MKPIDKGLFCCPFCSCAKPSRVEDYTSTPHPPLSIETTTPTRSESAANQEKVEFFASFPETHLCFVRVPCGIMPPSRQRDGF